MTRYLVQFSTGLGSAEVARRLVAAHGPNSVTLLTADVRAEDPDNWRFAHEVVDRLLGPVEWVILADGRTPMQVGRDLRVVPNNRMAVCSRVLKRELLRNWIDEHADPADCVIALGFDWTEPQRHERSQSLWEPFPIVSPLLDPPYVEKSSLITMYRDDFSIEPPRLYAAGFSHANCGGACVRGGQASWELLLRTDRGRYLHWEAEEEATRTELGKDVAILTRTINGVRVPLPLRRFREELDRAPSLFDGDDWGSCGCDPYSEEALA